MRAMKDSGIAWFGEIPEEWELVKTRRFFSNHKQVVGEKVDKYERLALTMNGVIKRSKDDSDGLQPERFETYQILHKNELIFKLIDLENIKTSRVGLSPYTGLVSPAYIVLSSRFEDNRFFYYWFMFMYYNQVFNHLGGNGVRSALNAKDVLMLPVPNIQFPEQRRIADYLDRKCSQIDAIIARQQEVIEKLKAYKLSVITEAVTKGLNPHAPMKDSGVEWIGEIPEHWEVRKAAFICDRLVVGVVIKPAEYFDDKGTIPFLRGINLKEYSINTDNLVYITDETNKMLSKSIVRSGDILIVRDGNIGVACVVPPFLDGANVVSMIIMTPMKRYNSCYICYFINSSIGKLQFELTKIGSALTHTSVSAVSKLRLAIPPEEEQNKIVEFLDEKCSSIEMFISKKQVIVDNLIAYKKSLIYEAVTGKKEV